MCDPFSRPQTQDVAVPSWVVKDFDTTGLFVLVGVLGRTQITCWQAELPSRRERENEEQEIPVRNRRGEEEATCNPIPDHCRVVVLFPKRHGRGRRFHLTFNSIKCGRLIEPSNASANTRNTNASKDKNHEDISPQRNNEEDNKHHCPAAVVNA